MEYLLTDAQRARIAPLLDGMAPACLIADRNADADPLVTARGAQAVIPAPTQAQPSARLRPGALHGVGQLDGCDEFLEFIDLEGHAD